VISADSHVTEPRDLWTRYIDPEFRDRAPRVEQRPDTDVFVCDGVDMFPVGIVHAVRYQGGEIQPNGRYDDIPASGYDPVARLADIEPDGVSHEVLYPTIAMRLFSIEESRFADACSRAYNSWIADFCAQAPDHFKATGIISLEDVRTAIEEMRRCRELGLAGVMIAVSPDGAPPYEDEYYADFWAAVRDLDIPVSMHAATQRRASGSHFEIPAAQAFLHYTAVQKTLIGMIYGGLFDRFPELKIVTVENDAGWAANIIERMDYISVKGRFKTMHTNHLNKEAPSLYWHRNIWYTMMRDRAAVLSREIIGTDRIMWASDFPHGDSPWPESMKVVDDVMAGVPAHDRWMMLHGNAAALYGFPKTELPE
jgi:predicted TIM-barrel fold metal-dependent hydrolase